MARTRVYVSCPHCKSRYSDASDETHLEGCPRPLERQVEQLQWRQLVNTCPHCKGEVHINSGDCPECVDCHTHWIASWTQGVDAIKASTVSFQLQDGPMPMTQLPGKGEGHFPRRVQLIELKEQLAGMQAKFKT